MQVDHGNVRVTIIVDGQMKVDMVLAPQKAAVIGQQLYNVATMAEQQMPTLKW